MKKIISILLVAVMLLSTFSAATAATHPFTDVATDSWYAEAVEYVYSNGLMNGMDDNSFAPNSHMSRAMIVTVLYRIAGSPSTSSAHPFTDVPDGRWFSDAIAWAYQNKIVNGMSATSFAPGNNVTREQMVTIFYNYANYCGYDTSAATSLENYTDVSDIRNYAVNAFSWAVATKIISGMDATHLAPRGNATRAQCAVIIQRFIKGTADTHTHKWNEATCTTPKTCITCGATEGSALGHTWKDGTCSTCGETRDVSVTRIWMKDPGKTVSVGDTLVFYVEAHFKYKPNSFVLWFVSSDTPSSKKSAVTSVSETAEDDIYMVALTITDDMFPGKWTADWYYISDKYDTYEQRSFTEQECESLWFTIVD